MFIYSCVYLSIYLLHHRALNYFTSFIKKHIFIRIKTIFKKSNVYYLLRVIIHFILTLKTHVTENGD